MTCKIFKFYCDALKQDTTFEHSGINITAVKVSNKLVCWCPGSSYHGNLATCRGKAFPFTKLLHKPQACVYACYTFVVVPTLSMETRQCVLCVCVCVGACVCISVY
jgi:hypothetical protein